MEKISFLASLNQYRELELSFCAELPDFVTLVKNYPEEEVEIFFDSSVEWTSELENEVEKILHANFVYT